MSDFERSENGFNILEDEPLTGKNKAFQTKAPNKSQQNYYKKSEAGGM